ncbi:MAG: glutamine amidotransferase [Candidatus Melainabacteria bacterium]|nr:glutamine amidotransferase [Candidatus Melainabacteria bacterium]
MELRIAHLYPEEMNMYGDRGNVLALVRRCQWRQWSVTLTALRVGDSVDPAAFDLIFMGGGQDSQQIKIVQDLHTHKAAGLRQAAERGVVFLTICGGYQLLGHYYKPHQGENLPGLGLIDAYTVAGSQRFIGNVSIRRPDGQTVVGFENHSGLTYLGNGVQPLGTVVDGYGNNGQDGCEGAVSGNLYGTYLHGSLLPKNPSLADELIEKALSVRYGKPIALFPLDDTLEHKAHERALTLKP